MATAQITPLPTEMQTLEPLNYYEINGVMLACIAVTPDSARCIDPTGPALTWLLPRQTVARRLRVSAPGLLEA